MQTFDQEFPCRIPRTTLHELATVVVTTVFNTSKPSVLLHTGVSGLPDKDEWPYRVALNAMGCLAMDDPTLAKVMTERGYDAPESKAALTANWCGFMLVGGYPTSAVDPNNSVLFALIILEKVILIELVQAKRDGRDGGWHLVKNLVYRLRPWAKAYQIDWIRANAINELSACLFQREGFQETKTDLFAEPAKFRMALRLEVGKPAVNQAG